jgi:hypothetical protein
MHFPVKDWIGPRAALGRLSATEIAHQEVVVPVAPVDQMILAR